MTPARLTDEIEGIVAKNTGRMSLIDIASYVGVGIEVVEPTVLELCSYGKGKVVNGTYITSVFVELFLEELGQLVADVGKVSLSDLTNKHWLPIEFVKDLIQRGKDEQKLDGCQLQGNFVVTEGFSRREFARIRGLLRGVTRPSSLSSLAQRIKIDEFKLKDSIDELVKSGKIGGKILKGLFVPTSFQKLQRTTILSQIKQNGYVEEALFNQLHINQDAEKFMR